MSDPSNTPANADAPSAPVRLPDLAACAQHIARVCEGAREEGMRPVVVVGSYDEAVLVKRELARCGSGFDVEAATLSAWADDAWQLFGEGSLEPVDGITRQVLMAKAVADAAEDKATDGSSEGAEDGDAAGSGGTPRLLPTPGVVRLACDLARLAMPLLLDDAAADRLAPAERRLRASVLGYRQRLRARGMQEPCEQAWGLPGTDAHSVFRLVAFDMDEGRLSPVERRLLKAFCCARVVDDRRWSAPGASEELASLRTTLFCRGDEDSPVEASGDVRFALSAGPTADDRAVAKAVVEQAKKANGGLVAVSAKDPVRLAMRIGDALDRAGVSWAASGSVRLTDTVAGMAAYNLVQMAYNPPDVEPGDAQVDVLQAADFERSPLSGATRAQAFRTERMERGNRLVTSDEVLSDIAENGDELACLVPLFERGQTEGAFDKIAERLDKRFKADPASHAVEEAANEAARRICAAAQSEGLSRDQLALVLEGASVPASMATSEKPQVSITTVGGVARMQEGSARTVVVAQMNDQDYPMRPQEGALSSFLEKLGVPAADDPLQSARSSFGRAVAVARDRLVLCRRLHDAAGTPSVQSAMFSEVVDCYRASLTGDDDIDEATGLPEGLLPFAEQVGEEDVVENAVVGPRSEERGIELPPTGQIDPDDAHLISLPVGPDPTEGALHLSASQIESYLECPYKWFAQRRMRLQSLDEGFGPMERGTFMHRVMQRFYEALHTQGEPRVTVDNAEDAKRLMAQVFHDEAALQPQLKPRSGRYVPVDDWETQKREQMLPLLQGWLDTEARMLPGFHPTAFEWQFGQHVPFRYAGADIVGSVDRIDVDGSGNAVVIDYKSSLNEGFRLHDPKDKPAPVFVLPRKMQALVYAKVVSDSFMGDAGPVRVVGAVYLNPLDRSKGVGRAQGAFDAHVVDAQTLPFAKEADRSAGRVPYSMADNFDQLIERSEAEVAARLKRLAAGDVMPMPLQPADKVCQYCPVTSCPLRAV